MSASAHPRTGETRLMNEITFNPITWPGGDKLWDVARAIAFAEGANVEGSVPDRLNNPGDLSDDFATYGGENKDGSNVTRYPTKLDGWYALRSKLYRAASGHSHVYRPTMSWTGWAKEWAGNWQAWVTNVTRQLGVSPDAAVGDYFK